MNNTESFNYIITALLPLSAFLLVIQNNPYQALIIRGILGAISALVYAILGAADVALTEALMGTLLAISLYVIAVRSSLVLKLGVLKDDLLLLKNDQNVNKKDYNSSPNLEVKEEISLPFPELIDTIKTIISKYSLRLDIVSYDDRSALENALKNQEIHAICLKENTQETMIKQNYTTTFRLNRLYEIFNNEKEKINDLTNLKIINS